MARWAVATAGFGYYADVMSWRIQHLWILEQDIGFLVLN